MATTSLLRAHYLAASLRRAQRGIYTQLTPNCNWHPHNSGYTSFHTPPLLHFIPYPPSLLHFHYITYFHYTVWPHMSLNHQYSKHVRSLRPRSTCSPPLVLEYQTHSLTLTSHRLLLHSVLLLLSDFFFPSSDYVLARSSSLSPPVPSPPLARRPRDGRRPARRARP